MLANTNQKKRILLAGNPNTGKTTLFNKLTGKNERAANFSGATVEVKIGKMTLSPAVSFEILDLPGIYSLNCCSDDERITANALLRGPIDLLKKEIVMLLIDSNQIERNLYLALQIIETGKPLLILLMSTEDEHETEVRSKKLKLIDCLKRDVVIINLNESSKDIRKIISKIVLDLQEQKQNIKKYKIKNTALATKERYKEIENYTKNDSKSENQKKEKLTEKIDKLLLDGFFGPIFLFSLFLILCNTLFYWSNPATEFADSIIETLCVFFKKLFLEMPLFGSFISDGVITGLGSVLAFVPLIAMLFVFIEILEESGYMARATFVLDKAMSKFGLPGKSFIPLFSSLACTVPAIMATRIIESKKARFLTIIIAPLISCSARLPIYVLLIASFFSDSQPIFGIIEVGTLVLLFAYLIGISAGLITLIILKKYIIEEDDLPLIMELPSYRVPKFSIVTKRVTKKIWLFIKGAGSIIFAATIVLWFLFMFPNLNNPSESYAGKMGKTIEPIIRPLGFDWKIGVGIIASFSARELFISTLAIIYELEKNNNTDKHSLRKTIKDDIDKLTGSRAYDKLTAVSLIVFFALSMQCASTLAVIKKETRSWKIPIIQFFCMTSLAWFLSFVTYQGGRIIGF